MSLTDGWYANLATFVPYLALGEILMARTVHIDLLPSFLNCKGELIWCQTNDVAVLLVDSRHVVEHAASEEGYHVWQTTHAPCFGARELGEWVEVKIANARVKRVLHQPSLSNEIHLP